MVNIVFFFLLTSNSYASSESKYGSCRIWDVKNKLLKCEQMERENGSSFNKFGQECLRKNKNLSYYEYNHFEGCPLKDIQYQCHYSKLLKSKRADSFFYYKIKKASKLRHQCLHSYGIWKSKDFDIEKSKQWYSCLKWHKNKPMTCEQLESQDKDQVEQFYSFCQINHQADQYFQFFRNKECPQKGRKFSCDKKQLDSRRIYHYEAFKHYNQSEFQSFCRSYQSRWKFESVKKKLEKVKWGRCQLRKKGEIIFCDEIYNSSNRSFENFFKSCQGESFEFSYDQRCSTKNALYICQGNKSFERHRYLYTNSKKQKTLLQKQCLNSHLKWIKNE